MVMEYEVELKLSNENTKEIQLVIRTEFAYSVSDAVMQAIYNQGKESVTGSARIDIVHVGPPRWMIELAETQSKLIIDGVMQRLKVASKGAAAAANAAAKKPI